MTEIEKLTCPKCGKSNLSWHVFCQYCGELLPTPRALEKKEVKVKINKKRKLIPEILGWVGVIICLTILISKGVSILTLDESTHVGPTLQTTAVVADRQIQSKFYANYDIYLDFSDSKMESRLLDILTQQQQRIVFKSREEFDHFSLGKPVTIVYQTVEGSSSIEVAIESVDGYEPKQGYTPLTTPGWRKEQDTYAMLLMGGILAILVLALIMGRRQRR